MFTNDSAGNINLSLVNALIVFVPWIIYTSSQNLNLELQKQQRIDAYTFLVVKINYNYYNILLIIKKLLQYDNFEMREVILNSIFNQISYPNIITSFFVNFILIVFSDLDNEVIHEHITRYKYISFI